MPFFTLEPEATKSEAVEMREAKTEDEDGKDMDAEEQEGAEKATPESRVSTTLICCNVLWVKGWTADFM